MIAHENTHVFYATRHKAPISYIHSSQTICQGIVYNDRELGFDALAVRIRCQVSKCHNALSAQLGTTCLAEIYNFVIGEIIGLAFYVLLVLHEGFYKFAVNCPSKPKRGNKLRLLSILCCAGMVYLNMLTMISHAAKQSTWNY